MIPTDFGADSSTSTVWTSESSESPVEYVVGLSTSIELSKIFVTFLPSSSYQTAVLQFFSAADSNWKDLQYYAVNCSESFDLAENAQ